MDNKTYVIHNRDKQMYFGGKNGKNISWLESHRFACRYTREDGIKRLQELDIVDCHLVVPLIDRAYAKTNQQAI